MLIRGMVWYTCVDTWWLGIPVRARYGMVWSVPDGSAQYRILVQHLILENCFLWVSVLKWITHPDPTYYTIEHCDNPQ